MELSDLDGWLADLPAALEPARRAVADPLVIKLRRLLGHLVRSGPGTSPQPSGCDALRRRGPAGQDGTPARLRPSRADLRPRRAVVGLHAQDVGRLVDMLVACGTGGTRCSWSSTIRTVITRPTT